MLPLQKSITELLLDERAAGCVRNLMRDVPIRDISGKITTS